MPIWAGMLGGTFVLPAIVLELVAVGATLIAIHRRQKSWGVLAGAMVIIVVGLALFNLMINLLFLSMFAKAAAGHGAPYW